MGKFPFQSNKVIEERFPQAKLKVFDVGFDQNIYRLKPFADLVMRTLPEFALGYEPDGISDNEVYDRLKEAAEILYKTEKYKSRGEFGELILHLLLRDFCDTTPLISKIYFKDAQSVAVHGFDAIHVTDNGKEKSLWLGEAKIYQVAKEGLKELIKDLKKHFTEDYLRTEFFLVSKKVKLLENEKVSNKQYWLDLMHKHTKADAIFNSITIPMLCVYDSEIYKDHTSLSKEYLDALEKEVKDLGSYFHDKCDKVRTDLNIILFLLPIPSKVSLVEMLHERVKHLQNI